MSLAQVSNDLLLERITYQRPPEAPAPIPWPEGLAPHGTPYGRPPDEPLPPSDVVVVTWTVAEAQALADALTPGIPSTSWKPYAHRWKSFQAQLTGRSPAHQAGCMAHARRSRSATSRSSHSSPNCTWPPTPSRPRSWRYGSR
jgi:hypothetical protein